MWNFQRNKKKKIVKTPSNIPMAFPPTPHPQTKKKEGHTTNPSHHVLQCGDGSGLQNELIHTHQGHGVTTRHILGGRFDQKLPQWSETEKNKVSHGLQRKGFLKSEDIQLGK